MDGLLKAGTILSSDSGNKYVVQKMLGAGGQGEVYDVESGGKHYALKWYFKHTATSDQKRILDNLILKGSPDASFLWPMDLICPRLGDSFGYIMELRPKNYKSIVDLMKRRVDPSFYTVCRAAFNLTKGYQKLHSMGYSYRDISFGNMFFDPENGDVLICDNDNVSVNGRDDSGVLGTPGFMAPEIVVGKAKPSRNTDLHSLAVLLFYMFMVNHPLNGRLEANIKCMDILAMERLYGTDPVFIFDPKDKRNRPVTGIHDNAQIYWEIFPENVKALFLQDFTVGLKSPNRRVTENQWLEAIANLMSGIMICPNCGAEVFYDERKEQLGVAHTCWNCKQVVQTPARLVIGKKTVILAPGSHITSHHVRNDFDMDHAVGTVIQNPRVPTLWGIRNEDESNWTYEKADGSQLPVPCGRSATIAPGTKIHFDQCTGEFI
ncbi:MAG: hypothetical protein LUE29_07420 [Lachnospiraceae bacterium]|nr:hypothetical protein [Lachnospiraceae bacterium]